MLKKVVTLLLVVACIKFLPMEMLIVAALVPFGLAIGLPIARGIEKAIAIKH